MFFMQNGVMLNVAMYNVIIKSIQINIRARCVMFFACAKSNKAKHMFKETSKYEN